MENQIFTRMLDQHSSSLKAFAYNFTHDSEDADDLYQDTIMKALNYFSQYKEGTNLKAWLFTIMRNTFINSYRREKRKNNIISVKEELSSDDLHIGSTKNTAEGNLASKDIYRMLAKLPKQYLGPFTRHFEGYKYHEIADELGIPLGTVKTRIHAAREILKKNLKPYAMGK